MSTVLRMCYMRCYVANHYGAAHCKTFLLTVHLNLVSVETCVKPFLHSRLFNVSSKKAWYLRAKRTFDIVTRMMRQHQREVTTPDSRVHW